MKVAMIGGTGLLGSAGAKELLARGHQMKTLSREIPEGDASLPQGMRFIRGDYMTLSDEAWADFFAGQDAVVFASGVDERIEAKAPIYDLFVSRNNRPLERILTAAKASGVTRAVICGSYFTYFNRTRPQLELAKHHPYIRSRVEQAQMALSFADDDFHVGVIELPYIFGVQPGRKPVWVFLLEMIRGMKYMTFFPDGGTTMVTVHQVGQAICGAVERVQGARMYPLGWFNMTWKQFLKTVHEHMGEPDRLVVTIPKWLFALYGKRLMKKKRASGIEGGLDLGRFADMQCSDQFITRDEGAKPLGVTDDDIEQAIADSVKLSLAILDGKVTPSKEMKG